MYVFSFAFSPVGILKRIKLLQYTWIHSHLNVSSTKDAFPPPIMGTLLDMTSLLNVLAMAIFPLHHSLRELGRDELESISGWSQTSLV